MNSTQRDSKGNRSFPPVAKPRKSIVPRHSASSFTRTQARQAQRDSNIEYGFDAGAATLQSFAEVDAQLDYEFSQVEAIEFVQHLASNRAESI
jgi:hypothetical protein